MLFVILLFEIFVLRHLNKQHVDSRDMLLRQGLCAVYVFNGCFAFAIDRRKIADRNIAIGYLVGWFDIWPYFKILLFWCSCCVHTPAALLVPLPFPEELNTLQR